MAALGERAEKAGRDPKSLSVTIFGVKPERAALDRLAQAGVARAIFVAPSEGRDTILPLLAGWAAFAR